jgi:WD40 repeat protein/tRNA A-37 threonylcarbamoyl transferase component Bud32
MSKTSLFDLGPEKLNRLLSIGKEDPSTGNDPAAKVSASTSEKQNIIEKTGNWIGRYKLLEVLGEGGMGIVYLAEQAEPIKRQVALKVIKPGMDSKRVIARFEAERQALALLDHPNIAHVYDAGTTDSGRPYFVMEYVEGLPITEHCDQNKLTIEERLRLFLQVCKAVQHAHQKGIIHRDIKPSNILVSTSDDLANLKIIDFGVAKALAQPLTERTLVTEQGQLFGTPEYMSPEQADMATEDIDTRSDIYSLGVLLYVSLTGVLPFDSKELRESGIEHIRKTIRETSPKTPGTRLTKLGQEAQRIAESRRTEVTALVRCLHRELEWIPLKAMRKERVERYRSVSELADDIENYLNGAPLIAGPLTAIYRLRKFVQRHKALVTGIAAVLGVLIAGIVVSSVFFIMAKNQAEVYRRSLYVININLADKYYLENNLSRVRDLLRACPEDLREWEWYYLWRVSDQSQMTLRGHKGAVLSIVFSPDSRWIVSGGSDATIKVWDANNGNELMTLQGHEAEVWSVAFSPDGRRIVSGSWDTTLKLWDANNGNELMTLQGHEAEVRSAAFSPDGMRIASGSKDNTLKLWDANNGKELMTIKGHEAGVTSVAFNPDGRRVVSGSLDRTIKVWDANNGSILKDIRKLGLGQIYSVAFSPDGRWIVSGGYNPAVKVYDADNYSELMTLNGGGYCYSITFSPDGSRITAGSGTATFKVWGAVSGSELMTLKGHKSRVRSVAFSPDSERIASGSPDRTIKVWDLNRISYQTTLQGHEGAVHSVAFSPDGRWIVSGSSDNDNTLKVWDAVSGSMLRTLKGHTGRVWSVAFSPDGERIVSGSRDRTIKVWDLNRISYETTLQGHEGDVHSVAFSPDGSRIVSGSWDNTIKVWDADSGNELRTLKGHKSRVRSVAFSPDGERIVSGSGNGTIKVWDAESYSELKTLEGHKGVVYSVAFSPDSSRIVSGSWDNTIKVWDTHSGNELRTLRGHEKKVHSVAFSPDSKRIVSCSDDKTIKLWDAESGDELVTLLGHTAYVHSVAFSPNGRRIVSAGSWDRTLKIWDIADPEEVEAELMAEEKGLSWIRRD